MIELWKRKEKQLSDAYRYLGEKLDEIADVQRAIIYYQDKLERRK